MHHETQDIENIKAHRNDITHMERIDLVDFSADFDPPLNLEPIPGGY